MTLTRRNFIRNAGGAVFAPSLAGLAACNELPTEAGETPAFSRLPGRRSKGRGGYGSLAPSHDCPELLIPEGFRCVRLSETTRPSLADSSFIVPQALDGMAAFRLPNYSIRLIRNHEIRDSPASSTPFGSNAYDKQAGGGTTSLEVKVHRSRKGIAELELRAEYASITGTHVNCAGGPTPWGTWATCEETTEGVSHGRGKPHGYVFEVSRFATQPVDPVPLKDLGRFVHEAMAVDPRTGFVYLTEDQTFDPANGAPGSGFYRFIPRERGKLGSGGRLQALAVKGKPEYDTTTGQKPGRVLPVTWVDIEDPDPADAETNPSAVFEQGLADGAAIFQRLEGLLVRGWQRLLQCHQWWRRRCGSGLAVPPVRRPSLQQAPRNGRSADPRLRISRSRRARKPGQHLCESARGPGSVRGWRRNSIPSRNHAARRDLRLRGAGDRDG